MRSKTANRVFFVVCLLLVLLLVSRPFLTKSFRRPPPSPNLPPIEETLPIGREAPPAPPLETPILAVPTPHPITRQKTSVPIAKINHPMTQKNVPTPVIPKITVPPIPALTAPLPVVAPAPVPQEWHGTDTSINHSGQIAVKTDEQWVRFWAEHHPHEAAPEVDFTRSMVVGVYIGARPADGFSVRISKVEIKGNALIITSQETAPPPGTFAVNVTVYPYALKVVPRSSLKLKYAELR